MIVGSFINRKLKIENRKLLKIVICHLPLSFKYRVSLTAATPFTKGEFFCFSPPFLKGDFTY